MRVNHYIIYSFICIFLASSIHINAQNTVFKIDTLLKFQIEKLELEQNLNKFTTNKTKSAVNTTKADLIEKNRVSFGVSLKSNIENSRIESTKSTNYIFTSNIDNYNKSQIIASNNTHSLKRGVNILSNLNGQDLIQNFDIYADSSQIHTFILTLKDLCIKKLFFVLVVDKKVEFNALNNKEVLKSLGFTQLADLKIGQAYIAYSHRGFIKEFTNDMSFSINLLDEYGRIIQPQKMIEKTSKEVPRFIAHAGGEIEGYIYTNSLEAMNLSYSNGSRLFELDICETSDSVFVATHDWDTWQLQTNFQGILPPTLAEYNSYKIFGKFSPIDMNAINSWFQSHPDAILVSDKVNEPKRFSDVFIDKSRLMMELFSLDAVKEGLTCGILSAMPSENVIYEINADIDLLANLGVKNIAVSRWLIEQSIEWFKALKLKNIEPYIYHVFDASLEVSNNMRHIYGLYADKWELLNK